MIERLCKDCGKAFPQYTTVQSRCPKCQIARAKAKAEGKPPRKPIKQVGKQTRLYNTFRDKVAIPYLDKRFGHVCSVKGCSETKVDVDHIKTRGAHHELKFDVKNLRYLCRYHHSLQTDNKLKELA